MTTTTSPPPKPSSSSSLTPKASVLSLMLLIMVGGIVFAAPSSTMAQQQTTTTTVAPTTTPPLTPEEQQQQERLQNTIAATTRNLVQGQKQVDGVVYTPRWSSPVWVEPNSLSLLFVYCLPGEFADSGQEILGGSELEVLESYSLAVTNDLTGWLMVVENENQTDRLPAAVGVICTSDLNDAETRVLSPQEQTEINNIIQQFITIRNTVINNVTQIINIINNVTTNQTGGGTTPPSTNDTGGNDTGGVTPEPLRIQPDLDPLDGNTAPASYLFEGRTFGGTGPYTYLWDFGDGQQQSDSRPQSDRRYVYHTYENPGTYNFTVTVTDATGQTASGSLAPLNVAPAPTNDTGGVTPEPLRAQVNLDSTDIPATYRFEADAHGGTPPYTYHWSFGDGQEANVQNTRHTYENPGTYTATLSITDATGQTASDNTEVIVQPAAPTTGEPTTTNETAAAAEVTPPPATGEGETTAPEQPPTTGGGVVAEEPPPPAGTTTTEGGEATTTTTTTPPASLDTLGQ
jgi:PKD repeat protein